MTVPGAVVVLAPRIVRGGSHSCRARTLGLPLLKTAGVKNQQKQVAENRAKFFVTFEGSSQSKDHTLNVD